MVPKASQLQHKLSANGLTSFSLKASDSTCRSGALATLQAGPSNRNEGFEGEQAWPDTEVHDYSLDAAAVATSFWIDPLKHPEGFVVTSITCPVATSAMVISAPATTAPEGSLTHYSHHAAGAHGRLRDQRT